MAAIFFPTNFRYRKFADPDDTDITFFFDTSYLDANDVFPMDVDDDLMSVYDYNHDVVDFTKMITDE